MYKDLSSALKLAEEVGASLPATSIAREMLRAAKSQGKGDLDSCVVMSHDRGAGGPPLISIGSRM